MKDKTIKERSERYRGNQKKKGLIQVTVWIPIADQEGIKVIAEEMRTKRRREMTNLDEVTKSLNKPEEVK